MARNTDIKVFLIASTALHWERVHEWLLALGLESEEATAVIRPLDSPAHSDAEALVALAGKRCYNSFVANKLNPNVTKIREDLGPYIANILKSGHGSVLEHATFTFAIEGCTRVFTPEMNRHRAGVAISEGSLRYIRMDEIAWWLPTSLVLTDDERNLLIAFEENVDGADGGKSRMEVLEGFIASDQVIIQLAQRKLESRKILQASFEQDEKAYVDLCELWKLDQMSDFHQKKKLTSLFRRVVGMGMATGGIWTLNVRALRHILTLRTSEGAEEEIRHVFDKIADIMHAHLPFALGDFTRTTAGEWIPSNLKV